MRALFVIILLAVLVFPSGHSSASPPSDISDEDVARELARLHTQAAQGDVRAQNTLAWIDVNNQNWVSARGWWEKAAAHGNSGAQGVIGILYAYGLACHRTT